MEYVSKKNGKTYFLHKMGMNGSSLFYFGRVKTPNLFDSSLPVGYIIVESGNGFPIVRKA